MSKAEQHPNNELFFFIFILILSVIFLFLFGDAIKTALLNTRFWLATAVNFVLPGAPFERAAWAIEAYSTQEWDFTEIGLLSKDLRIPIFLVFGVPVLIYGVSVWMKMPHSKGRRKMGRKELNRSEVVKWPWIGPVLKYDLIKEPIDSGDFAMALRPLEFCSTYKLMEGNLLDELKAEKFYTAQLGRLWEDSKHLRDYEKALYACFIAQIAGNKDECLERLKQISIGITAEKKDFSFADAMIKKYENHEDVKALSKDHAYVYTVLIAAWKKASMIRSIPPNHFIWLKPINRTLWFVLNVAGRRVPFPEVAGILGHYYAEGVAGHGLERPYVIKAVEGLKKGLSEIEFDLTKQKQAWDPWDWSAEKRLEREDSAFIGNEKN